MTLGNKIKQLRLAHNLSTVELSKKLNINRTTLSNYENDARKPDYDTLRKIALYFDVSVDFLIDEDLYEVKDIPLELREVGIEYIALAKEMEEEGLSPEAIRELMEFAKKIKK